MTISAVVMFMFQTSRCDSRVCVPRLSRHDGHQNHSRQNSDTESTITMHKAVK